MPTIIADPHNPWFVLLMTLGILQAMLQVPYYLSSAKLSSAGSFLELYTLTKLGRFIGTAAFGPAGAVSKMWRSAKRNFGGDQAKADVPDLGGIVAGQGHNLVSLNNNTAMGISSGGPGLLQSIQSRIGGAGAAHINAQSGVLSSMAASASTMTQVNSNLSGGSVTGQVNSNASFSSSGGSTSFSSSGASSVTGRVVGRNATIGMLHSGVNKPNVWAEQSSRSDGINDYLAGFTLGKVRTGNIDFRESKNGKNSISFDDAGNIKKIEFRKNASNAEMGMLNMVGALSSLHVDSHGKEDPRASSAVNNSVKDAHKWDPPMARKFALWLSKGQAPDYYRGLEKDRLEREKAKARISGSIAYLRGEQGNHYTKFLNWKFGKMDDKARAFTDYLMTEPTAGLGAFNLSRDMAIKELGRQGLDIGAISIPVASQPAITAMKPSMRATAIPAAVQLVSEQLRAMGIDPNDDENGRHIAATDGILRSMSPQHYRAANAVHEIEGLHAVTPQFVNKVMQIHAYNGFSEQPMGWEKAVNMARGRTMRRGP